MLHYIYRCISNNKIKSVSATSAKEAAGICMERYGFYPDHVERV